MRTMNSRSFHQAFQLPVAPPRSGLAASRQAPPNPRWNTLLAVGNWAYVTSFKEVLVLRGNFSVSHVFNISIRSLRVLRTHNVLLVGRISVFGQLGSRFWRDSISVRRKLSNVNLKLLSIQEAAKQ